MKSKNIGVLSGTSLKIIALIAMTLDHLGMLIFTELEALRIIGRLAFPIFAFMISEGCRYTKNKLKYFISVFSLGIICQVVYFLTQNSLYLNALLTLSFSILIIYSLQFAKSKSVGFYIIPILLILLLSFAHYYFKAILPEEYGFDIDYGIFGILLPVVTYIPKEKWQKLMAFSLCLLFVAYFMQSRQYWALLSVIPLMLYNGKPGKYRMKYLFYLYYPLHLAVIYLISLIV